LPEIKEAIFGENLPKNENSFLVDGFGNVEIKQILLGK